jgi:7-keto-8-aminopelargonate synthetase-like enzyme
MVQRVFGGLEKKRRITPITGGGSFRGEGMTGIAVEPGGEIERINFASNNYLGLNERPEVIVGGVQRRCAIWGRGCADRRF